MTETPATDPAKPLKVAIVGTAPTSYSLAPFQDESWDIWACSAGSMNVLPRVNIWFDMHAIAEMMSPKMKGMSEPYYAWLKEKSENGTFNVVMTEFNQFVPKALPYPLHEMIELFGRNWFTSSVAYMLAIAIARGAKEIALFGIDMAATQEHYEAQHAGCVRFIEIAQERGIKVHVPMESSLMASVPLYGYWEGTPFGRRINAVLDHVQTNLSSFIAQRDQLNRQIDTFNGAIEQLRYFQRRWTNDIPELDMGNLPELVSKLKDAGAPAEALDEIMQRDNAPNRAPIVVNAPITLNTSTAFDALLKPEKPNGHMPVAEPEPPTETMQS